MPTVKRKRKKHLRNLERNQSGRNATVKMEFYPDEPRIEGGEKVRHYAAPSITFKGNEPAKPQSFDQALEAGEVYEFMNKIKQKGLLLILGNKVKLGKKQKKILRLLKK